MRHARHNASAVRSSRAGSGRDLDDPHGVRQRRLRARRNGCPQRDGAGAAAAPAAGHAAGPAARHAACGGFGLGGGPVQPRCNPASRTGEADAGRSRWLRSAHAHIMRDSRPPRCGTAGRGGRDRCGPGYAVLRPGPLPAPALAALLGMLSGAEFPPSARAVADMAAAPRSGTLAGVQFLPAGRLGPGLLLVREAAAMAADCPAVHGLMWDGRYRVCVVPPDGAMVGAWGNEARGDRRGLPFAVARTLPVLRQDGEVIAQGPGEAFAHAPMRWMTDACFFPFAPDV